VVSKGLVVVKKGHANLILSRQRYMGDNRLAVVTKGAEEIFSF
jgi:hypothetical protein